MEMPDDVNLMIVNRGDETRDAALMMSMRAVDQYGMRTRVRLSGPILADGLGKLHDMLAEVYGSGMRLNAAALVHIIPNGGLIEFMPSDESVMVVTGVGDLAAGGTPSRIVVLTDKLPKKFAKLRPRFVENVDGKEWIVVP